MFVSVCAHTHSHTCVCVPFLAALQHKGAWEKKVQNPPGPTWGLKELPQAEAHSGPTLALLPS